MILNYPETPSKNVKGHLITKGDRRFRGDFVVGNLGGYLLFQADGNVVHWDVLARLVAQISRSRYKCYHSRVKRYHSRGKDYTGIVFYVGNEDIRARNPL